jgi:hypothetical protein
MNFTPGLDHGAIGQSSRQVKNCHGRRLDVYPVALLIFIRVGTEPVTG